LKEREAHLETKNSCQFLSKSKAWPASHAVEGGANTADREWIVREMRVIGEQGLRNYPKKKF
jgi:hypothetical protein